MKQRTLMMVVLFFLCGVLLFPSGSKEPEKQTEPVRIDDYVICEEYAPFRSSRLALLNREAALRLKDDLPRLDGNRDLFPVYASFVQAVYPKEDYNFFRNRSLFKYYQFDKGVVRCHHPYDNLIEGVSDIVFCKGASRFVLVKAENYGVQLNFTAIGKDAFVFMVNKDNPVDNLTIEQIQGIYSGRITNWKELGGEDVEIIPYQRENSNSQDVFEFIMGDVPVMEPPVEFHSDGRRTYRNVVPYTNYPNAIGYTFLFFTDKAVKSNEIKLLAIDGVTPSRETISSDEYVFADTFYAVTTGNESENTKKFIQWILSDQGQELIEKTGYVPVR